LLVGRQPPPGRTALVWSAARPCHHVSQSKETAPAQDDTEAARVGTPTGGRTWGVGLPADVLALG